MITIWFYDNQGQVIEPEGHSYGGTPSIPYSASVEQWAQAFVKSMFESTWVGWAQVQAPGWSCIVRPKR